MTQYKPMLCPVCGDFYFSELQEGDDVRKLRCSRCGWRYDLVQTENPDKENGANELSLNAYKAQYARKLADNPQYDFAEENTPAPTPHLCPVCGRHQFRDEWSFDICPFCGWEDDGGEAIEEIGANGVPFLEYKNRYQNFVKQNPKYKWKKDGYPI